MKKESRSKGIWNTVLEKCEKKLVNWKSQFLSLGGRLTDVNSVLDALPTYMMSLFSMLVNDNEQRIFSGKVIPYRMWKKL